MHIGSLISTFESRLKTFAAYLSSLTGRKRLWMSFTFGTISVLALPPFNFFPLLWICFPALIFLLQGTATKKETFLTGWAFAFGMFLFGWYWTAVSMFVDIAHFWWAVPFAAGGLPAFFAAYYGVTALIAKKIGITRLAGTITFALMWFCADYARGHLFGGFPWNLEAYIWTGALSVLQITSIIGAYGLTLLTLIAACLPASLIEEKKINRQCVTASLVLFILIAAWGAWRLHHASPENVAQVRLRLVQPNVDQARKWLAEEGESNFADLLNLSTAPAEKPVTHIIWPETAATFYLAEDTDHRREMAARIPEKSAIITGVIRRTADETGKLSYFNSLIAVDGRARIRAAYDKVHLVPFGEFMPLRKYVPIHALASMGLDFSWGDGPKSLRLDVLPPFSPLICYEVIFPGDVIDENDRPQFMINITNDGWYGNTTGPYQHFAMAKTRAVEEGLPLVRAANTGISGVVDSYGRVQAMLGLSKKGFLDSDLPKATEKTIFTRYGEGPLWFFVSFLTVILILERFYVKRTSK